MKFKVLMGTATYALKKFSPEILLGLGIVGVVGSTVLACTASLKAEGILDEFEEQKDQIEECALRAVNQEVEYSKKDEKQDRRVLALATTGKFIRLYGPSATLMFVSIGCILGAHHILAKRNLALMAAYKVVEEAFSNYRRRVITKLGNAADGEFMYGVETIEGEGAETRIYTDPEGNEHELTKVLNHLSGFSRSFGPDMPDQMGGWMGSTQWSKVHEYNLDFLKSKEEHFNQMLLIKGFVTVNDVYSELGFPATEAGMICGWRYKSDRGDGYISFKPRNIDGNWAFGMNGESIVLDFNIDGVIFDQGIARKEMK